MVTGYCSAPSLNVEISSSPDMSRRTAPAISDTRTPRSDARERSILTCSSGLFRFRLTLMSTTELVFAISRLTCLPNSASLVRSEIGRPRTIDIDLQLGIIQVQVDLDVDHRAGLRHLPADLLAQLGQLGEIRA